MSSKNFKVKEGLTLQGDVDTHITADGTGGILVGGAPLGGGGSPATPTSLGVVYGGTTDFIHSAALGNNSNEIYWGIAIGDLAGNNSTGSYNTFVGAIAGAGSTGSRNTTLGNSAGRFLASDYNIAIGDSALRSEGSGGYQIAIGQNALIGQNPITGTYNIALGNNALYSVIGGSDNIGIGSYAGFSLQGGSQNIIIGKHTFGESGALQDGSNNIVIGNGVNPTAFNTNNEIVLGNYDNNRFRIPGLGLDTANAANEQVLAWDAIGGPNGTGGFAWATVGGGGGSPATPTTLGTVYGQTDDQFVTILGLNGSVDTYGTAIGGSASALMFGTAIGRAANVNGEGGTVVGDNSVASTNSISVGSNTNADGTGATAIGTNAFALGDYSIALGHGAYSTGFNEIVIGSENNGQSITRFRIPGLGLDTADATSGQLLAWNSFGGPYGTGGFAWASISVGPASPTNRGTVYGFSDQFDFDNFTGGNTALGHNSDAGQNSGNVYGTAIGSNAHATAGNTIAIGSAFATATGGIAIGSGAQVYDTYSIALGENAICGYANQFTVGATQGSSDEINRFTIPGLGIDWTSSNVPGAAATPSARGTVYGLTDSATGNTGLGDNALAAVTSGGGANIGIGESAGQSLTSGAANTVIGKNALNSATTANFNVAIGRWAGLNTTSDFNVLIGNEVANSLSTGENNIVIGAYAEPSSGTASAEITIGSGIMTRFRIPGLGIDWSQSNPPWTGTFMTGMGQTVTVTHGLITDVS